MPEIPQYETEQNEYRKRDLSCILEYLSDPCAGNLINLFNFKEITDSPEFLIGSAKVLLDQLFCEFKEKLNAIQAGAGRVKEMFWLMGHEGNHTTSIYVMIKDNIPASEVELHQRGEALLQLSDFYRYHPSTKETDGMSEKERTNLYEEEVKEEVNKLVKTFATPLLDEQTKQEIINQLKTKIKADLEKLT